MSFNLDFDKDSNTLTVDFTGRFDLPAINKFEEMYVQIEGSPGKYVFDLANTTYIDSSAVGLIVALNERTKEEDKSGFTIKNANDDVKAILSATKLDQILTVE